MNEGKEKAVIAGALLIGGIVSIAIGIGYYFSQTGVGGIESNPSFAQITGTDVALIPIAIGILLVAIGFAFAGARP